MTKSRGINQPKTVWTEEMDAVLTWRYPYDRTQDIANDLGIRLWSAYSRAKRLGLKKSEEFMKDPAASGRLDGLKGGSGRFKPGHVPANKGKKGLHPGSSTSFAKGHLPWNKSPKGAEKDHLGFVMVKVTNGGWPDAWRLKHHVLWEAANGPVPDGHKLHFVNGDRTDFRLENLKLVSDADWMRQNSIHNLPPELADTIRLLGRFKRKLREIQEEENGD